MGYGFIEFENRTQANEALEILNGKPLPNSNKTFKLNWASYNTNKIFLKTNIKVSMMQKLLSILLLK